MASNERRTRGAPFMSGCALLSGGTLVTAAGYDSAEDVFKEAWSHATLWTSPSSDANFALSGRLQLDSYWFSVDKGDVPPGADDNANDTRWRRFRFGFISGFGGGYTIQLEADLDLNNDLGSLYNRLTDAYVGYRRVFFRFTCQRGSRRALGVSGGRIQWGRQRGNRPRQCGLFHPPVTGIRLLP